jgi:poly-gamma-glutamate synthesis protein (capsule biosynthesis protein)
VVGIAVGVAGACAPPPDPYAVRPKPVVSFPPVADGARTVLVAASGDVLPHSPLWTTAQQAGRLTGQAYDFRPMFAPVAPLVTPADLAICHLETPLVPPGEALSTFPLYGVPHEIVQAIATAGYDRCSTASNHSLDRGMAGIDTTLNVLDANLLGHSGTARTPAEATVSTFRVKDTTVAHLSYTWSFNGLRLPADVPWRANLIDPDRIVHDAAAARGLGAEIVVVSIHWGWEYDARITPDQAALAERLTASGQVDLIIGHHAHVVQPTERRHDRWILYGLGNHLSNMRASGRLPAGTQDGVVAWVRFVEQPDGTFLADTPVVWPTWVEPTSHAIVDVLGALSDPALPMATRRALVASLDRTRAVMGWLVPA